MKATFEIGHLAKAGLFRDFSKGSWFLDEKQAAFAGGRTLYMDYTLAMGLMSGYSGTSKFGPYDSLTRAQAATILYRLANPESTATTLEGDYATENTTGLSDVETDKYYTAAVNWAKDLEIITGYLSGKNAGKFLPEGKVTRQELATMIYRFCMKCSDAEATFADVEGFDDSFRIADWAVEGLGFCKANGIMNGVYGTNKLNPTGNANRAEMSKMIAVTARDVM